MRPINKKKMFFVPAVACIIIGSISGCKGSENEEETMTPYIEMGETKDDKNDTSLLNSSMADEKLSGMGLKATDFLVCMGEKTGDDDEYAYEHYEVYSENPPVMKVQSKGNDGKYIDSYFYVAEDGFLVKIKEKWYHINFMGDYKNGDVDTYSSETEGGISYNSIADNQLCTYMWHLCDKVRTNEELKQSLPEEIGSNESAQRYFKEYSTNGMDVLAYVIFMSPETNKDLCVYYYITTEDVQFYACAILMKQRGAEWLYDDIDKYTSEEFLKQAFDIKPLDL